MMTKLADHDIFQHAARPEWGAAIIAWEREGKRGYRFEDGCLRIFTAGHYHLLEPIDASPDRLRKLRAIAGPPADAAVAAKLPPPDADVPTLDEQVAHFRAAFPGGFTGDRWRADHRSSSGHSRKRHRDHAVALAQKELAELTLAVFLEKRREADALEVLANVLGSTDLVPAAHLQRLQGLPPHRARAVLTGLFDLLFGKQSAEVRVVQWVEALSRATAQRPAWGLATTPLALVFPDQHVCIHRTSFAAQKAALELRSGVSQSPSGPEYGRLLAMARSIRIHLDEVGCSPADFLDVHDFILFTLGAGARQAITARR
jgi:hypothetical protein